MWRRSLQVEDLRRQLSEAAESAAAASAAAGAKAGAGGDEAAGSPSAPTTPQRPSTAPLRAATAPREDSASRAKARVPPFLIVAVAFQRPCSMLAECWAAPKGPNNSTNSRFATPPVRGQIRRLEADLKALRKVLSGKLKPNSLPSLIAASRPPPEETEVVQSLKAKVARLTDQLATKAEAHERALLALRQEHEAVKAAQEARGNFHLTRFALELFGLSLPSSPAALPRFRWPTLTDAAPLLRCRFCSALLLDLFLVVF